MKRISYAVMSTLTALVLLFGYRTSTSSKPSGDGTVIVGAAAPGATSTSSAGGQATPSAATPSTGVSPSGAETSASAGASPSSTSTSAGAAAKTVTGDAADTRWGPVQVQLTVKNGKVTNVSVVQYPNNNGRDQEINAQALPILISETLKAQTAKIDMVSGATYTSDGYITSLQSALTKAGL